ncbi:MAG TPA: acetate kinase [Terriglobia bacterium]|nr:acetate kinase [Terriglobia bacterium]
MNILVINCGSSTVKFQLIETSPEHIDSNTDRLLAKGEVDRIGSSEAMVNYQVTGSAPVRTVSAIQNHTEAVQAALDCLTGPSGLVKDLGEIQGVGHRVVHGGEALQASTLIDDQVAREIERCVELAPLHNPHNLKGYEAARKLLPQARQVAVFDTAFHHAMPAHAFHYAIPMIYYARDRVRRYGFHGTSHRYLNYRFARLHGHDRSAYKVITCHLGNGCSVCAIDHGRSIDTSMGLTPLEGLIMGTRPGDLDPGVLCYLLHREGMAPNELEAELNRHSGLYGISGVSGDMRDLLGEAEKGSKRAELAIDMFCYRVKKYIGAYLAALNGADGIVFSGGIGENAPAIRARICEDLGVFGIQLDPQDNSEVQGPEKLISPRGASPEVWVIRTNEELLIARDTVRCILGIPHPI